MNRTRCLRTWILLCALLLGSLPTVLTAASATSPTPARVLIVYCANWPQDTDGDGVQDSLQVANYYAARRGVPAANILGLTTTNDGGNNTSYYYYTAEYGKFYTDMVAPIQAKLTALGPTNIDVILLCYGLPYRVYTPNPVYASEVTTCIDNVLMGINYYNATGSNITWSGGVNNPYCETTPGISTDKGHFDHASYKFNATTMYLVTRLDGPRGVKGALELVDQAAYGDRYVAPGAGKYNGFAYVDSRYGQNSTSTKFTDAFLTASANITSGSYGSYYAADENMAYAEHYVLSSGFTLKWENTTTDPEIGEAGATFSDATSALTAPRALFYSGWYNYNKYQNVYGWLPGSVACDLNSNSLANLRVLGSTFGGNALHKGATCVSGVVSEPYLTGHPRPNIQLYYMLQGYTFAEAAGLCTPSIGWQGINVGDPLYAPLRAKTIVTDTQFPQPAAGYPQVIAGAPLTNQTISLLVSDSPEPEVVQVQLQYGTTVSYGASLDSGQGFWRRHSFALTGLTANTTYHYRLVLTDPVGNVTTTADSTFYTGVGGNLAPVIDSPAGATPNPVVGGNTTAVSVTAHDPDSGPSALTYTWVKISGPGSVSFSPNGTTGAAASTATFSASGSYTLQVTVSDGAASVTSQISGLSVTLPNAAPTVATAAAATPSPVTATTTALSVLGADDGGEAALTYTWAKTSGPGTVSFSPNGANTAKNSTATFTQAGSYTLTATLKDAANATVTSSVSLTVNQTLTTVTVSPSTASVMTGGTQTFSAAGRDQFNAAMSASFSWTVSGGGTISGAGLFTAGGSAGGPYTVTATSGAKSGTAQVTVTLAGVAPTITTPPASQTVAVGQTATFTVTAAGTAPLTYQWQKNSSNIAGATAASYTTPVTVSGDNGATYRVIVTNGFGTVTSSAATLTVNPAVNPVTVSVGSVTFSAPVGSSALVTTTITLTNSSGGAITVTPTTGGSAWLSTSGAIVVPAGSTATLTVTADPTGLSGTVTATLTLTNTPGGQVHSIPVTLTIGAAAGGGGRSGGCELSAADGGAALPVWWALSALLLWTATRLRRDPAPAFNR